MHAPHFSPHIRRGIYLPTRETIHSGFSVLDDALGGGVPRGVLSVLSGVPTSGVTTLAYHLMHHTSPVILIDLARHFDAAYAAGCGVALDALLLIQPPDMGQGLAVARDLLLDGFGGLLVFDAGFQGLAKPDGLRLLLPPLRKSRCALVWVSLGASLPDGAALRLSLRRLDWRFTADELTAYHSEITVQQHGRTHRLSLDIPLGAT